MYASKVSKLEALVRDRIKEGYMPIGGVSTSTELNMQAMVWAKGLRNG